MTQAPDFTGPQMDAMLEALHRHGFLSDSPPEAKERLRASIAASPPPAAPAADRAELAKKAKLRLNDFARACAFGDDDNRIAHGRAIESCIDALARSTDAPSERYPNLTERLQQKCSDWNTYWRAPDAHGVNLSHAQAVELLQDALGVEVEVATPPACPDEFREYVAKNYNGEVVFHDPAWHAERLWRAACHAYRTPTAGNTEDARSMGAAVPATDARVEPKVDAHTILRQVDEQKQARAEQLPTEQDCIRLMVQCRLRLVELEWRSIDYAPKQEGKPIDAIVPGWPNVKECHWLGSSWFAAEGGDFWPVKPAWFKARAALTQAASTGGAAS